MTETDIEHSNVTGIFTDNDLSGTVEKMYEDMEIQPEVFTYGNRILKELETQFREIDEIAEYNQIGRAHV